MKDTSTKKQFNKRLFNDTELEIIHDIGLRYGYSDHETQNMVKAQFELTRDMISDVSVQENRQHTIMLINFGKFAVIKRRWKKLRNYYGYKDNRKKQESVSDGPDESESTEGTDEQL